MQAESEHHDQHQTVVQSYEASMMMMLVVMIGQNVLELSSGAREIARYCSRAPLILYCSAISYAEKVKASLVFSQCRIIIIIIIRGVLLPALHTCPGMHYR